MDSFNDMTKSKPVVQLGYSDHGTVVITPQDEDRFALTIQSAVEACAIHLKREQLEARFRILLNRLADWLRPRLDAIADALLTERDGMLLFLVVMKKTRFDSKLEEDLTSLELEIRDDPQLEDLPFTTMALPNVDEADLMSFVNRQILIRLPEKVSTQG